MSRDWIGFSCEFHMNGELWRGDIRQLDQVGLVVESTAPLEVREEVDLRLLGGMESRPVRLRCVVEEHLTAKGPAKIEVPCIRFRLLRFSMDYARLLSGARQTGSEDRAADRIARAWRDNAEREWLTDLSVAPEFGARASSGGGAAYAPEWEDDEPLDARAGVPLFPEAASAPEAIVIDEGELDDVVQTLARLGIKTERQTIDARRVWTNWLPPQKLLVVSARSAIRLQIPIGSIEGGFVPVAVADNEARTVHSTLSRLGFRYIISRPAHPVAVEMLFQQAIFEESDRRAADRSVLGCPVEWRSSWARRRSGLLLDLSLVGCQLLVRDELRRDRPLRIFFPSPRGGKPFAVDGRIVRSRSVGNASRIGIVFEALSERTQQEIQILSGLPGPVRLTRELDATEAVENVVEKNLTTQQADRRKRARMAYQRDIVSLDAESMSVRHAFVCRDLSLEGMRIEAHPSIELGERLCLALYEDAEPEPILLRAEAARNDGRSGWWLRFVDVEPELRLRLERALDCLAPSADGGQVQPELGRLVLNQLRIDRLPDDEEPPG